MSEIEVDEVKVEKPEEKEQEPRNQHLIPIGPGGKIMARNNSELIRYCGAMITGGGVPERFDKPAKLFAALMYVRDLGLPDTAIRQVANIHGVMCCFGDLPLALVQKSKEQSYFSEQWFDREYKVISFENKNLDSEAWGAVCRTARNGGEIQSFSFTLDDAKKAGMFPPKSSAMPWAKYTKLMLRYKARSIALKSVFADKLEGVAMAEYDFDSMPGERDVSPSDDRTSGINELLNKRKQSAAAEGVDSGKA